MSRNSIPISGAHPSYFRGQRSRPRSFKRHATAPPIAPPCIRSLICTLIAASADFGDFVPCMDDGDLLVRRVSPRHPLSCTNPPQCPCAETPRELPGAPCSPLFKPGRSAVSIPFCRGAALATRSRRLLLSFHARFNLGSSGPLSHHYVTSAHFWPSLPCFPLVSGTS